MALLFPLDEGPPPDIAGLEYVPGYISAADEDALCQVIDAANWDTSWDRRRQPYGAAYGKQGAAAPEMPTWGRALADRIFRDGYSRRPFDQMLINEYLPGQGIALHRDYDPY